MGNREDHTGPYTRHGAIDRDDADELASFRDRFHIPDEEQYMDGNSLGLLSEDAEETLDRVVDEWRTKAIRGWTDTDPSWFTYGEYLGDRLAPLVGAEPEEVVVANSTTVNIHTLIGTFIDEIRRKDGPDAEPAVLVNELDFPTDHYAIAAQLRQRGINPDEKLRRVESADGRTIETDAIVEAIESNPDVGIVFMPGVLYRSGQLLDIETITQAAHDHGAYAGFDCAHSIGVVPHDFSGHGVDFAVWCTYKYLNAGPGSLAGLYVNKTHFGTEPALAGWWGHEKATQFEMNQTFTPAGDAGAWQIGTVSMLSAAPLEGSLSILEEAGIDRIREKSIALTDYLIELVDERLGQAFSIGTPRELDRRGGHVAIEHPEAAALATVLRDRGVIVDFRPPNVVRVCPSPLCTRFVDVWDVVEEIRLITTEESLSEIQTPDGVT
ncbi:kynureninase [Halalkalirubrum salinum]|uniref:kynureninase n=1 Tax=Halalkalirubrum salinum TaxID=2563889 RepID=UPI0010FBBAF8|nr:kynureninase [Halalkalirubrum salinum]